MNAAIIAIGDEVLLGFTNNTNASYLAQQLLQNGITVTSHQVVGDTVATASQALHEALTNNQLVITTGGLGPTIDDHTREMIAHLYGTDLQVQPDIAAWIKKRFPQTPEKIIENQSLGVKNATYFLNERGTAPGFAVQSAPYADTLLICLPGVPYELHHMVATTLLPFLQAQPFARTFYYTKKIHLAKCKEIEVDPVLRELNAQFPQCTFGIYPALGKVTIHIHSTAPTEARFNEKIAPIVARLVAQFGPYMFESESGKLEEAIQARCLAHQCTLALAESCTGGAIAARLISIPGASQYIQGGIVAYSNQSKEELLSVPKETLEVHGAVSIPVTEAMAEGAQRRFHADIGIAVSGILGPTGGSTKKPVGTVAMTIRYKDHPPHSWSIIESGDRDLLREKVVQFLLAELCLYLKKLPFE